MWYITLYGWYCRSSRQSSWSFSAIAQIARWRCTQVINIIRSTISHLYLIAICTTIRRPCVAHTSIYSGIQNTGHSTWILTGCGCAASINWNWTRRYLSTTCTNKANPTRSWTEIICITIGSSSLQYISCWIINCFVINALRRASWNCCCCRIKRKFWEYLSLISLHQI
jgi:hypothetical protein